MKMPFIIYADLESLLEKMSTCHNNPEKSPTTKIDEHTTSGYSLFTIFLFDLSKSKLDCYRGKDCMEKFLKGSKEHATKIINYEKKKRCRQLMKKISLIKSKKYVIYAKKDLVLMMVIKGIIKSEIIVIILEIIKELLMIYVI